MNEHQRFLKYKDPGSETLLEFLADEGRLSNISQKISEHSIGAAMLDDNYLELPTASYSHILG